MIIIGKKFDIRVWVLVTSVEPLTVFAFNQPYLRFTSEDYDPSKLRNKFTQLTNASISKENYNSKQSKTGGKYKIINNMWETENFAEYLRDKFSEITGAADPLQEIVFP